MLISGTLSARAADPEIDRLLQSPVGKDWVTNGGNMTNQRYATLKQIDTTNASLDVRADRRPVKGAHLLGARELLLHLHAVE